MNPRILCGVALLLAVCLTITAWAQSPTASNQSGGGGGAVPVSEETTQVGVVDGVDGPFLVIAWYDRDGFIKAMDSGQGITDAIVRHTRHVPIGAITAVERPGDPDPAEVRGYVLYEGPYGDTEEALIVDLMARQNQAEVDDDLASLILDRWGVWLAEMGR
jgi:hypothetical protein